MKRLVNVKLVHALTVLCVIFGMCILFSYSYTRIQTDRARAEAQNAVKAEQQRAEADLHRWCELLVSLDDRNQTLPPSSDPDTNKFRNEIHKLRIGFNCG